MFNNKEKIHGFFQSQINELNTEEMPKGHQDRFLQRMELKQKTKKRFSWFKYGTVAASIILLLNLFVFNKTEIGQENEINYPTELSEAKFYFEGVMNKELSKIKSYKNKSNKFLIEDTLEELQKLKSEEEALLSQLSVQYNRRIVKALIDNFQIKIELLENVSQQIEQINQLKNEYHENNL